MTNTVSRSYDDHKSPDLPIALYPNRMRKGNGGGHCGQVRVLILRRVRATLEGVCTCNAVSSGGDTTTATTTCWLLSRGCTGKRILIRECLGFN